MSELSDALQSQIKHLIVRMKQMFPKHEGTIEAVKFFFDNMLPHEIMKHVIDRVLPWEDQITERNENFFIENKNIFGGLSDNDIDFYSRMVKNGEVNDEQKEEIFDFFIVFVECAKQYQNITN